MYLFSLRVWTEGGALSLCPLALALAKTDMWEGHAGQTQAESIRIPLLVCMSPCYQGSRVSVERIAICTRCDNLGYLSLEFARSRSRSLRCLQNTPQHIKSLPLLAANAADCSSHARRYFESAQHGVTSASSFILSVVFYLDATMSLMSDWGVLECQCNRLSPHASQHAVTLQCRGLHQPAHESLGSGWTAARLLWMFNSRFGGDRMLR